MHIKVNQTNSIDFEPKKIAIKQCVLLGTGSYFIAMKTKNKKEYLFEELKIIKL